MTTLPPGPAASSEPTGPAGDDEELLAAYVGPSWHRHYQRRFAAFRAGSAGPTINLAAALAPMWLAFRRYWLLQVVACVAYWAGALYVGLHVRVRDDWLAFVIPYLALGIIEGLLGDQLIHWRATRALARVRARGLAPSEALTAMRRAGGTSALGPVLIPAGSVAAMYYLVEALSHRHHHGVYVYSMRSDLRNLVTAEESYFADNLTYTTSLTNMQFTPSTGVTVTVGSASDSGWSATATHNASPQACGIFVGTGTPPVGGASEAEPKCGPAGQVLQHRH